MAGGNLLIPPNRIFISGERALMSITSLPGFIRGAAFGLVLVVCLLISTGIAQGQGTFLYALNNDQPGNRIYGFSVNETTGALTPIPGVSPLATGGTGAASIWFISEAITIDAARNRLYAVNIGSKTISAYAINPTSGGLTELPFSPIPLPDSFTLACTISVHPSGSPLVVGSCDVNAIASYVVTATTATPVAGNPVATTTSNYSSTFTPDGNFFYTGGNNGATSGFSVDAGTGVLTQLPTSPFFTGPFNVGLNIDSSGRLFAIAGSPPSSLRPFVIGPSGTITPVTGFNFPSGAISSPSAAKLSPNGNFYAVAARNTDNVGVYQISGAGAATTMAAISGSPFATGGTLPCALAFNRTGNFLFVANGNSRNLTTFASNPATGVLTAPTAQAVNALGASGRIFGVAYYGPVTNATCGAQSVINSLVTFAGTGSLAPPTCGAQGYTSDYVLRATITNNSGQTLCSLAIQVLELAESTGTTPAQPFRLISADGATCTSGGLPGSIQSIAMPATLAPGESATVDLRVAMPEMRRFRFYMNVLGGVQSEGGNGLNAGIRSPKRAAGPVMIEVDKGRVLNLPGRFELAGVQPARSTSGRKK